LLKKLGFMSKSTKHGQNWRIRYIDEKGFRVSATFPTHKEADSALILKKAEIEQIKRGLRLPSIPKKTFSELCDYYLQNHNPLKRRPKDDECMIRVHLLPAFGAFQLKDIEFHIQKFKIERSHLSSARLYNLLTLLSTMLKKAYRLGWIQKIPHIEKPSIRLLNNDFQYLKTKEEIRSFLYSAHKINENVYFLYNVALNTGMRLGELAALKWKNIDFNTRLITVARSFNGPTKNGEIRRIPILDSILPLLKEKYIENGKNQESLVFPNKHGKMYDASARIFQEILHQALALASFPKIEKKGKLYWYISFHDLRHTFASHWMMNGGDIFKLKDILGHKSIQMTMRYAHLSTVAYEAEHNRMGEPIVFNKAQVKLLFSAK